MDSNQTVSPNSTISLELDIFQLSDIKDKVFVGTVILTIVASILNLFVIVLLFCRRHVSSSQFVLNLNLIGTGILLCTAVFVPFSVALRHGSWDYAEFACTCFAFGFRFLGCLSKWILCGISLERTMFVREQSNRIGKQAEISRKSDNIDRKLRKFGWIWLSIALAIAVVISVPPLLGHPVITKDGLVCMPSHANKAVGIAYTIVYTFWSLTIPAISVTVCCIKFGKKSELIKRRLRHNRRSSSVVRLAMIVSRAPRRSLTLNATGRRSISSISSVVLRDTHIYIRDSLSDDLKHEQNSARAMFALIAVSLLTWTPFHVISILVAVVGDTYYQQLHILSHFGLMLSATIHPIMVFITYKPCVDSFNAFVKFIGGRNAKRGSVDPLSSREGQGHNDFSLNQINESEETLTPVEEIQKRNTVGTTAKTFSRPHRISIAVNNRIIQESNGERISSHL